MLSLASDLSPKPAAHRRLDARPVARLGPRRSRWPPSPTSHRPDLATWTRIRGRLAARDLLALLFEDAAVLHAVPFAPEAFGPSLQLEQLPDVVADAWLQGLTELDLAMPGPTYIATQAEVLGLPTRMARSDLHVVKSHQRVLELPDTGGQLAHHLVSTHAGPGPPPASRPSCRPWSAPTGPSREMLDDWRERFPPPRSRASMRKKSPKSSKSPKGGPAKKSAKPRGTKKRTASEEAPKTGNPGSEP